MTVFLKPRIILPVSNDNQVFLCFYSLFFMCVYERVKLANVLVCTLKNLFHEQVV